MKPKKVKSGDKVTTVSPSSGMAGDSTIRWRYEQGVKRLQDVFGLEVVPMPNSLKGLTYNDQNPQARAEDLMAADEQYYEEYKEVIQRVMQENNLQDLPILYNLNFGHTEPKFILPYGAMAEIDCQAKSFSILENGVE